MELDIPHVIATGVVIFGVLWAFNHLSPFTEMTKGRRTLFTFLTLFVVLMILNLLWPYGSNG